MKSARKNKGVLVADRLQKRVEAERRNALHDKGDPCNSPACPYQEGGPKAWVKSYLSVKKSIEMAKVAKVAARKPSPNKAPRKHRKPNGEKK